MKFVNWKSEIRAPWKRALDLKDLRKVDNGLHLEIEEESGKTWGLDFKPVQAWKVTSEEFAGSLIAKLPAEGSMFLGEGSEWQKELEHSAIADRSKHFVICCYDEIIEVLALNCLISSTDQRR